MKIEQAIKEYLIEIEVRQYSPKILYFQYLQAAIRLL